MKKIVLLLAIYLINVSINAQSKNTISKDWTSFTQSIDVVSDSIKKFKIVASVKVISKDTLAWAGVWARVDTKNDETGFFDNMWDRPIKSDKWQSYTVEGEINADSKTLNFGGLCKNNADFYFDKFEVYIENDKGVLEPIKINNPSFETKGSDNLIPNWIQNVSNGKVVKVEEFDVTPSKDSKDGNYSILIKGKGIKSRPRSEIGVSGGASPQIGAMISMLEDLKHRVERAVKNLSLHELDHLHDEKANRIGALIMHLAAAEAYYQVFTFEGRKFNEEEKLKWQVALRLDQAGRDEFKGHEVQYYLDIYNKVRAKTIEELKKRDDKWFKMIQPSYGWSNTISYMNLL